jgi:hypothetical protein
MPYCKVRNISLTCRSCKADFLFADRTFSSLDDVGNSNFCRFSHHLLRCLLCWKANLSLDYQDADCYKIMSFDPEDQVIPLDASLPIGVTKIQMIQELDKTHIHYENSFKNFNYLVKNKDI